MRTNYLLTIAITLLSTVATRGEVSLPSVLSDGVILQRNQPITIWGKASPGEQVNVALGKQKASVTTAADSTWSLTLKPMKAGGPYTLKVNSLTVNDVLIGDLYLCSGQSNMELPVRRVMDFYRDEVNSYTNDKIREFKTPKEYVFHGPASDVKPTKWKKVQPGETSEFGALVYFMAKELFNRNGGVPVGVVNSSWGGSKIETWLSEKAIAEYPDKAIRLRLTEDDEYRSLLNRAERRASTVWNNTLSATDRGYTSGTKWSAPTIDTSSWKDIELLSKDWGTNKGRAINGSHWLKKKFNVPASHSGSPAELRLGCIVDADSVWVNGTFVGFTSYQYPPRIYPIPANILHEGENEVTVRLVSYSGTPHFVPEKPHKIIFDNEEISLEGTWKHALGTQLPQAPGTTDFFQTPTVLYNGLIAPMAHLPFSGVVWYQGESDIDIRHQYTALMKSLINDWRSTFNNPTLPFYIVELADFLHPSDTGGRAAWQEMRDAQRQAAEETPRAHWIRNGDVGEWNDIHPRDKKTPGTRVANAVLSEP